MKFLKVVYYTLFLGIIYWIDSFEKTGKRAVMPNPHDHEHGIGFAQNLEFKGLTKPSDIAVDWVAR